MTELEELRARAATLTHLVFIGAQLSWDQNTYMPPAGAEGRASHIATLESIGHERLTDPKLGALLDSLKSRADGEDPDSDDVRLIVQLRREHERALRVPTSLVGEMAHAASLGRSAWQRARDASDFTLLRDSLARQIDLRHRYVECFDAYDHPYDVLLDGYEPGFRTAELRPLMGALVGGLAGLVEKYSDSSLFQPFGGPYAEPLQDRVMRALLHGVGFDDNAWRLDTTAHPFAARSGPSDLRIATRYLEDDFESAYFAGLHEFGHALYESKIAPRLNDSPLGIPTSLGIHESQSRLWENMIGRGLPFCTWALPLLSENLTDLSVGSPAELYRAVNVVRPSLIRVEADETTYNLHIALRFELEVALIEGNLAVDDLPAAWNERFEELLGIAVTDDASGVLQDIHWGIGLIGYFPTYALGNLMAAQLWESMRAAIGDLDEQIARGDFSPLIEWLRVNVHRDGSKYGLREALARASGTEIAVEPLLRYLAAKLAATAAA